MQQVTTLHTKLPATYNFRHRDHLVSGRSWGRIIKQRDRQCAVLYVYRNIEVRSCNSCCSGKAVSVTCSVCVCVALVIQHEMRMRHIVTEAYPALQYFSTLSHKRHDIWKKLLNTKCVFWFSLQLLSETFLILRRTERDISKKLCWSSCEVPLFLPDFSENWILSTDFRKILKYQIQWNSVQ